MVVGIVEVVEKQPGHAIQRSVERQAHEREQSSQHVGFNVRAPCFCPRNGSDIFHTASIVAVRSWARRRGGDMDNVGDRLADVSGKVATAVAAVGADSAASPVLAAVVREFDAKAAKARDVATKGPQEARDAVVELEQAGDSAKAAAEADRDASEATRQAVLDAHLSICMLKAKL